MKNRFIELSGLVAGIAVIIGVPIGLDQLTTGRVFLSWPNGSIWSNMWAWLWCGVIAAFSTWYFRDRIGKRLAAWWGQHHPQKDALKAIEAKVNEAAAHALAARHIANDTYKAANDGQDHPMAPGNGMAPHPTMVVTGPETDGSGQANPAAT